MSAQPQSCLIETWRCQDCGGLVNLEEVILEEEFGFEGEAWGTYFRAQAITQVVSPCCRAFIVNNVGNFLPAEMVNDNKYF